MHAAFVVFVLLYAGLLAGWALVCALLRRPPGPAHTGGLILLELTVIAQAALDIAELTLGGRQPIEPATHAGYLATAVLLLPLLLTLTRPPNQSAPPVHARSAPSDHAWRSLLVAMACVALIVVEIRLVATGAPAASHQPADQHFGASLHTTIVPAALGGNLHALA